MVSRYSGLMYLKKRGYRFSSKRIYNRKSTAKRIAEGYRKRGCFATILAVAGRNGNDYMILIKKR